MPPSTQPRERPLRALAGWATTFLVLDGLIAIADAANTAWDLRLLADAASGSAFLIEPALEAAAARRSVLYFATLGAMSVTALVFLPWFWRAYTNVGSRSPRWAVLGWFIPIGNFYLPHRYAQEIREGSGNPTSSWTVFGWWTTWLGSALLERLSGLALRNGELSQATQLHLAASGSAAISAALAIVFVQRITRAQAKPRAADVAPP